VAFCGARHDLEHQPAVLDPDAIIQGETVEEALVEAALAVLGRHVELALA
jgi:hypothetical protein